MSHDSIVFLRTRLAPTPSGFLHLGNVYSFALTAALAKKTGAKVLLRIDDMDTERVHKEYIEDIFDTLNFMEIPWEEGPKDLENFEKEFSQSKRMELYEEALQKLRDKNLVYACNCSRSQILAQAKERIYPGTCRHKNISLDEEGVSWRLKTDPNKIISANLLGDEPLKSKLPTTVHDIVIRRKDKLPAYQLTSVVDDNFFGVDLIVRGKDLLPSTLLQLYLAECLEIHSFKEITFLHHDLLLDEQGKKLSKTAGSVSIRHLKAEGYFNKNIYESIGKKLNPGKQLKHWTDLGKGN